jgi:hypothetical protein
MLFIQEASWTLFAFCCLKCYIWELLPGPYLMQDSFFNNKIGANPQTKPIYVETVCKVVIGADRYTESYGAGFAGHSLPEAQE